VVLDPGDDAAVVHAKPGRQLCITTDALRDGVHFGRLFRPEEIGHKALAVNLSDLAAMGAHPRWFTVALELPPRFSGVRLDGIARGMARLAAEHRCALIGGNVIRGDALALTLCAIGEVPAGGALRRDGLRAGDWIAVSGRLGVAAFGLKRLCAGSRLGAGAQLSPTPRVNLGVEARKLASAAIDVSDGLARDLHRMLEASGCGATIWGDKLPTTSEVRLRRDWLELCLRGGEDYELCLGVPPEHWSRLRRRADRIGVDLTVIGEARSGRGLFFGDSRGARARPLSGRGFDHF
jgi:thiamine-monophosphate kinase